EDSRRKSESFFKRGFVDVFGGARSETPGLSLPPEFIKDLAEKLYEDARCGLSHDAMTRHRIMLSHRAKAPIGVSMNKVTGAVAAVVINPGLWVDEVDAHLKEYVARLRDVKNVDLRTKFETLFKLKNPPGHIIELPPEAVN